MTRPWRLRVGLRREVTYSTREAAVGAAVSSVYNGAVGLSAMVENATTGERVGIKHEPGHIVRVRFHNGHGE